MTDRDDGGTPIPSSTPGAESPDLPRDPIDSSRRWWLVAAAAAGLAGGAWLAVRHGERAKPAPEGFWSMSFDTPDGGTIAMSTLQGRPLVVNFWATWCAPCVREMPEIDRFYTEYRSKGVQVLGLAIDGPTPVRDFLTRVKVSFPIGLAGLAGTDLVRVLGNERGGLPFTVALTAEGRVLATKLGETNHKELAGWVPQLI